MLTINNRVKQSLRSPSFIFSYIIIFYSEILLRARYLCKEIGVVIHQADQRQMYTRYYNENRPGNKQTKKVSKRKFSISGSPRVFGSDASRVETPCLSENDTTEENTVEPSNEIDLKNLFLMELPDKSILILYPSGKRAISRTSTGYTAIFANVSRKKLTS